jgi:GT2 family glycosyltransferase
MGLEATTTAVVLTWRDTGQTVACVKTLLKSDDIRQVIVVDNESAGLLRDPLDRLQDPRARLVEEPRNLGFSAGVNVGLRAIRPAAGGLVLVINNDAVIGPDDVATLIETLQTARADLVAPQIVAPDGAVEPSWGTLTATMGIDRSADPADADYFSWACVLFRHDLLDRVGCLDEKFFMYYEDVEFGLRLRRSGAVARYVPAAVAIHLRGASHSSAGAAVEAYAAHSVIVLSRLRRKTAIGLLRVFAMAAKRLLERRPAAAGATLKGAWLALTRPDLKGCQTFPRRGSPRRPAGLRPTRPTGGPAPAHRT